MLRHSLLLLLLFPYFSFATSQQPPNLAKLTALLPKGSQFALTIIDSKTGEIAANFNQDLLLPPASTQKVVTALAASLYLDKQFRFETSLYQSDQDVVVHFGGDPTLTRQQLKQLLAKLKQHNIKQINGNIWLDDSIFAGFDKGVGWPWDALGVCYSAPASAITLEENCFHGTLYANSNKSTRIYVPKHQPIRISTDAKAFTEVEQQQQHCDLDLISDNNNHYQLSGCMTRLDKPLPLQFAVQNPAKYAADVTKQLLNELGISLKGEVFYQKALPVSVQSQKRLLARHSSQPRDALLKEILKDSNNLVADNLLKTIGHHYYQTAGTFRNGVSAVKAIIKQKTGIDLAQNVMVDGSGLSRNNRMTSAMLANIIQWIYKNSEQNLLAMLPIAGVDGTLKYRQGVRYSPIKTKLIAKSGSLYGSYNLAGILQVKDRDLIVVQFVANYFVSDEQKLLDKQNKNNMPIVKFEKTLYESLLRSAS